VPSGATTGPISVATPGGAATSGSPFTVVSAPTITGFTPGNGPVGASVTITGTNFTGTTTVRFNGTAAAFAVSSDGVIQATVPAGATTGPIDVTTPGGAATSAGQFTVIPAPTITGFTPGNGPVGASVTITGTNLTGTTAVRFNGTAAAFSVMSNTTIQATVPSGATTGPISVTTPAGTAASAGAFTVRLMLTVNKTGLLSSGTVTSTPAGITCGSTCAAAFDSGAVVTLTATPAFLSVFTGWTGCDSTSGRTCTVTLRTGRVVTAHFIP
jgi:hypothetical protein